MTILVVDDSEAIRARLVTMLSEIAGIEIVAQAETVAQALRALRQLRPDAMILDLRLPDGNGLEVLRTMQREQIATRAIVLTNYPHPQYGKCTRAAGAYAFLDKARDFAKLAELLEKLRVDSTPAARHGAA